MDLEGGGPKPQSVVTGFMNHMLEFNSDTKRDLCNLIQYSVIALVPLMILNKGISGVVPEANDMKSTMEISIEVLGQTVAMLIGLMIIDRFIVYVPTYSGNPYEKASLLTVVLPLFMILLTLQTKIGEKANILYTRVLGVWNGNRSIHGFQEGNENEEEEDETAEGYQNEVRAKQPMAENVRKDNRNSGVQYPTPQPPAPQMRPGTQTESRPQIAAQQTQMSEGLGTYNGGDSFSSAFSSF
jgi:hypothetical protein|uniref:Uncharacterized protein n=1 Tax=viral metagenome TaxID=1070528 RepID=A0A6C0BW00_9ZZZZ